MSGFREAFLEAPEYSPARAILATANYFDGKREVAFEQAAAVLRDDPSCEQAALIALQAAPNAFSTTEVEKLVPETLDSNHTVGVVLATILRDRGDHATALRHARASQTSAPEDWRAAALLAELLLAPLLDDPALPMTKAIPPESRADFERALELLVRAWAAVIQTDYARHALHIALNLSTALDIAGDEAQAALVTEQGLSVDETFYPLLRRRAVRQGLAGDWSDVLITLNHMRTEDVDHEDRLLAGQAELVLGRPAEARRIAQQVLDGPAQDRSAALAAALALEADIAAGLPGDTVDAWLDRYPESMLLRTVVARLKPQRERLRERLVADVTRLTQGPCDLRDRIMGADVLAQVGEHGRAADLLDNVVGTSLDTLPLRSWLRSLLLADRRMAARQLFERLPASMREQRAYLELGVAIYERAGALPKARALLEGQLSRHPDDLHTRLAWLHLCERLVDMKAARDWLGSVPEMIRAPPQDLMALAHAVDRHLTDGKALGIGYRAVRSDFGNPRLQLAYSIGLILQGRAARALQQYPAEVAPDTAVLLEQVDGDRRLTRVIDTAEDPRIERDEVMPSDSLAVRLLGLRIGDTVAIETMGLGTITFRVAQITSKFLHLHFRILADFESRFPEFPGFGSVPFDPSKGVEALEPMLRLVRQRGDFIRDLEDQYRRGMIPLSFVAAASGATMFDVWEAFTAGGESRIYTSNGSAEEFSQAADILLTADLVVLEPMAVYATARLDLEPALRTAGKQLGVTQTTRDLLRALVSSRGRDADGKCGTLAWDGERYLMRKFDPEEQKVSIQHAEAALALAERCDLVIAEGSGSVHLEAQQIWRFLPEALQDSLLAAQNSRAVLLSDDLPLRRVIEASAGLLTVWTQPLLQLALRQGRLEPTTHSQAVGKLIERNYEFTMFGALQLQHALERAEWKQTALVCRFFKLLAKPTNDPETVASVLAQFTEQAWRDETTREALRPVLSAIFREFRQHDIAWAERMVELIAKRLGQNLRQRALLMRKHIWLRTSTLVPVESVAAEILAPAERLLKQIMGVFATCFDAEPFAAQSSKVDGDDLAFELGR